MRGGSGSGGVTWRAGKGLARSGERRARWRARGAEKSGAGQLGLGKAAGKGSDRVQR
jgi:hypothetical protein